MQFCLIKTVPRLPLFCLLDSNLEEDCWYFVDFNVQLEEVLLSHAAENASTTPRPLAQLHCCSYTVVQLCGSYIVAWLHSSLQLHCSLTVLQLNSATIQPSCTVATLQLNCTAVATLQLPRLDHGGCIRSPIKRASEATHFPLWKAPLESHG